MKLLAELRYDEISDDFKVKVLARFSNDEIGDVCRSDRSLIPYGYRLYDEINSKMDRSVEVK